MKELYDKDMREALFSFFEDSCRKIRFLQELYGKFHIILIKNMNVKILDAICIEFLYNCHGKH